ncbi:MAG TPA: cytochrome c oxidase subunit 3, partial [Rhodospirillaceae bacterium]|nr:cytochrome c oxidase subunit 3 [Rhodospirillaceae bacterium]
MVEPSKWPLMGSIAALVTACGAIWFMHGGPWYLMGAGFVILFYTFWGWWKDVISESLTRKFHTDTVSHGLRVGMLLFIASEV